LASGEDFEYMEADIARVVTRAEEAASDTLYLCLRTAVRDGALGAMRAYENGCRLFLSERDLLLSKNAAVLVVDSTAALSGVLAAKLLGYPARRLTVLGITGSAGKTSVADTDTTILHRA
jgi:UDP-N-acetylmuramyl pentapeptide synthase